MFSGDQLYEEAHGLAARTRMKSETFNQIRAMFVDEAHAWPSAIEFEMAYQARVAMDRIRFAIKHTEQFAPRTEPMREASLQLLEALERLQMADRRFQERSRCTPRSLSATVDREHGAVVNGGSPSHEATNGVSTQADDHR